MNLALPAGIGTPPPPLVQKSTKIDPLHFNGHNCQEVRERTPADVRVVYDASSPSGYVLQIRTPRGIEQAWPGDMVVRYFVYPFASAPETILRVFRPGSQPIPMLASYDTPEYRSWNPEAGFHESES